MSTIEDRLDRLESLVEQQQETIEDQQETIRKQRERIADLEADKSDGDENTDDPEREEADDPQPTAVNRRTALKAGGLLAALGVGATATASADPSGQIGTSSAPLEALYTDELYGNEGTVTVQDDLDLFNNDLEDEGTTVWDSGNGYIPQSQLQNDSVTVTAGDGLTNGGSASLGASTTLDINPADFAGRNLTTSGSDLDYDPPENVVVVAKSGGDYTSVSSALGSISDNKASNPYVIKVEPGVYDEKIQLKSHVDIVGAGLNATRIETTQSVVSDATLQLDGASNVEVRNMTVQGDNAAVTGETSGSDVTLQRLRLRQTGLDNRRVVSHEKGTLTLRDCIVRTTRSGSEGIEAYGGTVEIVGCRIEAPDNAVFLSDTSGPTVKIRRSFVEGSDAIDSVEAGSTAEAAYSHLKGGVSGSLDSKFQVHDGYSSI